MAELPARRRLDQPLPGRRRFDVDTDMFLAGVPGADKRVFLVGVKGKRLVPNPDVFDGLRRAGVPFKGDVSSATLSVFPTIG